MVFRKHRWGKWIGAWDLNTVDSQQAILAVKIRVLQVTSFKIWIQRGLLVYTCLNWHTHTQTQDGCFETFVVVHSLSPTLCDPMNCCTPDLPVLHYLPEFTQTHVHWCHPTISSPVNPPPLALNLSQHQGLFQWAGSSHQVARELELQLWQRSFQWIFKVDFL